MSKSKAIRPHNELNMVFWIVMCFLGLYMLIAPYYRGLFNAHVFTFEGPIYGAVIAGTTAFGLVIYYLMRNWEINSHRDVLAIIVWFIPLTYWISSFGAASSHLAANEVMVKFLWAIFFMIGAFFTDSGKKSLVFQSIFVICGYLLVTFGFLVWFGQVYFEEAVLNGRLSNAFQYPNAYAAVLIGLVFANIIYAHRLSNLYAKMAVNAMLVPLVLSFMLTLSRGALLVMPIVLLVFLFFLNWRDQISTLLHLAVSGVASLLVFSPIMDLQATVDTSTVKQSMMGWGLLITASVINSALIFIIDKYKPAILKDQDEKKLTWTSLIVPLSMVALIAATFLLFLRVETLHRLLPEEISSRFEELSLETASVYDRNAFYKDALSITNDYPWFGTGGGGWTTLYHAYKSYPYKSTQAHNFYFQYLVEAGWIGTIIFLAFVFYVFALFMKIWTKSPRLSLSDGRLMYPIFASAILIHSFLDFDMSFVYISTIVMMMLGAMAATATEPQNSILTVLKREKVRKVVSHSIILLFVVSGLVVLFGSITSLKAHQAFSESQEIALKTGSYSQLKPKLDEALDLKPYHPDYNLFKISIMHQLFHQTNDSAFIQQSAESLAVLNDKEPYNRLLLEYLVDQALLEGKHKEARSAYFRLLEAYPWDIQGYEKAVEFFVDSGLEMQNFNDAFLVKHKLDDRIKQIESIPPQLQHIYRNFKINHKLAYHYARVYFSQQNFQLAADILSPHLNTNLEYEYNLMILRLYVASLQALGKDDERWKHHLYTFDPTEEQRVQQIVNGISQGETS